MSAEIEGFLLNPLPDPDNTGVGSPWSDPERSLGVDPQLR